MVKDLYSFQMKYSKIFNSLIVGLLFCLGVCNAKSQNEGKPNIVIVLCDDLGYGDVQILNPERGKIPTPQIDNFAKEGMIFTDAHSGSSVCTPTRYGLLTGRYSWRTRLQKGVVQGYSPCLIAPDRPTIASFLKEQGYNTAIIGKWHLDFDYVNSLTGDTLKRPKKKALPPIGSVIPDGPLTRGFDYYHGFHHARDMKAVIENDRVIEYDEEINMLPRITSKAIEYIDQQASDKNEQPFFLYLAYGSPHTPIVPSAEWQGKSNISPYADFVMQNDASFGAVLNALEKNGFGQNTLVVFSSDNGCSKAAKIQQLQEEFGHYPSADMRGSKADIWDGGHRVPFIVRWPDQVEEATSNNQLICLTDLFATTAEMLEAKVADISCEDSYSFLAALKGNSIPEGRKGIIHHSIDGYFAYRSGPWKLCLAKGSGGWSFPREKDLPSDALAAQLYNLDDDPTESINLYEKHPEEVKRLLKQLEYEVEHGRTTPGDDSKNDLDKIVLWKGIE